jgi:hypothetical protein
MMAEFTARKTLETAMWNLCQHAEAQDEKVAALKSQVALRKKIEEVHKAERKQERHEAEMKEYALVDAIRELRDHIITPSKTAEQSARRYEKIVQYAEETLEPYRDYDENYIHPEDRTSDDEQTDDEQTDEE